MFRLPQWFFTTTRRKTILPAMRARKSKQRQWQYTVSTLFPRTVPTVARQHVVHRLYTRPVRLHQWIRVLHRLLSWQACCQCCVHPLHHLWQTRIPTETQRHRLPEHSTRSLPIWTHHASRLSRGKVWCGWRRRLPSMRPWNLSFIPRKHHV
jgi:hypothetical protein